MPQGEPKGTPRMMPAHEDNHEMAIYVMDIVNSLKIAEEKSSVVESSAAQLQEDDTKLELYSSDEDRQLETSVKRSLCSPRDDVDRPFHFRVSSECEEHGEPSKDESCNITTALTTCLTSTSGTSYPYIDEEAHQFQFHCEEGKIHVSQIENKDKIQPKPKQSSFEAFVGLYLSAFAIIGAVVRVYVGRFFGRACEEDLPSLFSNVCFTSSETALFIDLPANMVGSFFMGFLSIGTRLDVPTTIAWLNPDHFFQDWSDMHLALRTGFCGSLTTFASWNAQMVTMIDGTGMQMGSQIISAIFGYIIGVQAAYMSLKFGQNAAFWTYHYLHRQRSQKEEKSDPSTTQRKLKDEESLVELHLQEEIDQWRYAFTMSESHSESCPPESDENKMNPDVSKEEDSKTLLTKILLSSAPFFLVAILFLIFAMKDQNLFSKEQVYRGEQNEFFRRMWLTCLISPFGALSRWKLSLLLNKRYSWIPVGTLTANLVGSLVSISCVAAAYRLSHTTDEEWTMNVLFAIKTGFAGCLSTVSTFIDEFDTFLEKYPRQAKAYKYVYGTLLAACFLSLCIYSPTVRIGIPSGVY